MTDTYGQCRHGRNLAGCRECNPGMVGKTRREGDVMDDSKPTRADVEFFLSETADSSLGVYKDGKLVKGMSLHNVLRSWLELETARAEERAAMQGKVNDLRGLLFQIQHFLKNRRYKPPELVEEVLDGMVAKIGEMLDEVERGEHEGEPSEGES